MQSNVKLFNCEFRSIVAIIQSWKATTFLKPLGYCDRWNTHQLLWRKSCAVQRIHKIQSSCFREQFIEFRDQRETLLCCETHLVNRFEWPIDSHESRVIAVFKLHFDQSLSVIFTYRILQFVIETTTAIGVVKFQFCDQIPEVSQAPERGTDGTCPSEIHSLVSLTTSLAIIRSNLTRTGDLKCVHDAAAFTKSKMFKYRKISKIQSAFRMRTTSIIFSVGGLVFFGLVTYHCCCPSFRPSICV